ncbi:MAG: 4-hydroxy-tetrahydrodipicolinate reductase [Burkholderiaceae bacterium]|nr:4-hydroxy-tetrahydrodipicolinate reductase [Microbacteriaceae bacterium]
MTTTVAVVGATGKLGQIVTRIVDEADDFTLGARLNSASPLEDMLGADLVVDVSTPAASHGIVDFAVGHGLNVLVGTSGWTGERILSLETRVAAHPGVGVLIVPNFSVGSVIGTTLATLAARFFDSIEIVEAHSASKIDSPSGTAVRTAELIGVARGRLGPVIAPHTDQRARGQQVSSIPIHSLRLQGLLARQDVVFGGTGETLTISHVTQSGSSYESGILLALRAANQASGVTVGLDKLLGLDILIPSGIAP